MRTSDVLMGLGLAGAMLIGIAGSAVAQDVHPAAVVAIDGANASGEVTNLGVLTAAADSPDLSGADAITNFFGGAGGGVSSSELLNALEGAAEAGQPDALWRLGLMYENGEGVKKDDVKAFGYFSRIANDYATTSPKSLEAGVVAQSFVKIGEYYREGLPDAGIGVDPQRANALIMHAASYFGDADAQYQVGELYLDPNAFGPNPLQGARWLSLAARKGHVAAQARLGDLLFNGEGIAAQPVEGLMWLTIASNRARGTPEESWVVELLTGAMSIATPDQRKKATALADTLGPEFSG